MDPEKTQPAPVVVPRAHGDIIIRQFQPRDTAQVHAMLYEGLIYGPESPRNTALRRNLTSRISCACYATFLLGAGCIGLSQHTHTTSTALTRTILKLGGGALCLGATLLFSYVRRTITGVFMHFCNTACRTDMADITASYEIPAEGEEVKQGPAGFWVAVIEAPDGKEEEEVVGYLGLDYRATADPTSGELRRMIVSARHRRRRIGSLLIEVAMAHARNYRPPVSDAQSGHATQNTAAPASPALNSASNTDYPPPLRTLDLETSEFQPGAQVLYGKHGFSHVGSRVMRGGPLISVTVVRMRRAL